MYKHGVSIVYSPSDLCRFMVSPFAAWMERYNLEHPKNDFTPDDVDPLLGVLQSKGEAHEASFLEQFRVQGKNVVEITGESIEDKVQATISAMQSGTDVIFQACLELAPFRGYADFLVKVAGASKLGDFYYEVWDTKLSKSPKPYFAVQLCVYAEMLAAIQGMYAEHMVVALGNGEVERLRTTDFRYFYENLKAQFLETETSFDSAQMLDPADSREWGQWSGVAEKILLERDHLSQVVMI